MAPSAHAQGSRAPVQIDDRKERQACMSGRSHQDQATCLREVVAARQSAQQGTLWVAPQDELQRNAMRRCEPLPAADREACEARMRGEGTVQGSVEQGGIYRELVVREVGTPAADPAPASPSPMQPGNPVAPAFR